jgi:metal-responsive CopG/Arc/MetJ family transcriptional regulator
MSSKRTNITVPEDLYEEALKRVKERYCTNFSSYVEVLIREDVERRQAGTPSATASHLPLVAETPAPYTTSEADTSKQTRKKAS